ncbi:MAG: LamG domain-containing protein, partial [Flavobacteriales bacterium]|nr:LamG domain-containing protein [Flavobacteriales bacterium]
DISFLPTCTEVEIISPDNSWTVNNSFNDVLPISVGGYDINGTDFEKVKVLYKPSSSSSWILLESFFRDTNIAGWVGEPTLPQTGNTFSYNWQLGLLPDGNYDIKAIATCTLAETNSVIHTGIMDRLNPELFGAPQPSDGVLTPGEEISVQFNEPIDAGILSSANIDVRGVLNAGSIRHDASIYFSGAPTSNMVAQQINMANTPFTIELYAKRTQNGVDQAILSQGVNTGTELSVGYNTSDQVVIKYGGLQLIGTSAVDNNWHHITFTYDLDNQDGSMYLDGVLEVIDNTFIPAITQKEDIYVGISKSGSVAHFEGNVHEVRIWNKSLTVGEINLSAVTRMMGNEAGLLHNWEMEEATGSLANDKVRGKHAAVSGTWAIEPVGYGLRLNGEVNQAILDPVQINGSQDYTVEFWFKSDGIPDEIILSNGAGTNIDVNTSGWALGIDPTGNFVAMSNDQIIQSTSSVLDAQWHHAAVVCKAQGNATLYLDAVEQGTISSDSLNGFSGPKLWVGQRGWFVTTVENNDKQFNGNIDEIRIWNTARSLDQLDRDRYNKLTGDEPGLTEYYAFEDYTTSAGITTVTSSVLNGASNVSSTTDTLFLAGTANLDQVTPSVKLKRPVNPIPFTYSVNTDQIIITPVIDDWMIENIQLDFTVSFVKDMNGNTIESPITWTAYVDRNQVVWQDGQFSFEVDKGTEINFQSDVVNNSGQSFAYTISNVPSWLNVSSTSGTAGPLSTTTIGFTVPNNVNAGTYQQDILLTTAFGYDEKLEINVKVKEVPPTDWTVDPTAYQYSMDVIGQIAFNGVISRSEDNMLGAFVNGVCRGAIPLTYVSGYDYFQAFLSIYSNTLSGEEIEYRVWDASTGNVHVEVTHSLPTSYFVSNAFYGTPSVPELFDANNNVAGDINVAQGWNWLSFNLLGSDLDTVNTLLGSLSPSENDLFKTRQNDDDGSGNYTQWPRFDTYTAANGWLGSLSLNGGADVKSSYKLLIGTAGTINYSGEKVDPLTDTIHVMQGWNYLGYLGQLTLPITEAMNNFTASSGDILKSQYASAIYDAAMGWIGSLTDMDPNKGYMLYSNLEQDFTYPLSALKTASNSTTLGLPKQPSEWSVNPHAYQSNMTIIAHIANDDENFTKYNSNVGVVGAFVDGVCRGVAHPIYDASHDQYIYVLTVSGDVADSEIDFKYVIWNIISNTKPTKLSSLR